MYITYLTHDVKVHTIGGALIVGVEYVLHVTYIWYDKTKTYNYGPLEAKNCKFALSVELRILSRDFTWLRNQFSPKLRHGRSVHFNHANLTYVSYVSYVIYDIYELCTLCSFTTYLKEPVSTWPNHFSLLCFITLLKVSFWRQPLRW